MPNLLGELTSRLSLAPEHGDFTESTNQQDSNSENPHYLAASAILNTALFSGTAPSEIPKLFFRHAPFVPGMVFRPNVKAQSTQQRLMDFHTDGNAQGVPVIGCFGEYYNTLITPSSNVEETVFGNGRNACTIGLPLDYNRIALPEPGQLVIIDQRNSSVLHSSPVAPATTPDGTIRTFGRLTYSGQQLSEVQQLISSIQK
jgi:hypothetical protein